VSRRKHLPELPFDFAGVHPTSLVTFRERLVANGKEGLVFDAVVATLQTAGLIKRRNKQRPDSTRTAWPAISGAGCACWRGQACQEVEMSKRGFQQNRQLTNRSVPRTFLLQTNLARNCATAVLSPLHSDIQPSNLPASRGRIGSGRNY